jgi:hypothetical protein
MRNQINRIISKIRRPTSSQQTTPKQKVATQQYLPSFEPVNQRKIVQKNHQF